MNSIETEELLFNYLRNLSIKKDLIQEYKILDRNNISDRLIIITNENKNKPICIFKILNDDIYITNEIIYNCLVARHKISKSDIPFYIVKSDKSALIFNKIVNQEIIIQEDSISLLQIMATNEDNIKNIDVDKTQKKKNENFLILFTILISTFSIAIYSIIFKENSLKTQIGLFQKEQSDRHSHEISPSDIRNNYEDFYIADSVCADSVVLDYIPIISKSNEQIKQIQNQDLLKELEKRILIIENGISDNPEKTLSNKNLEQQIINLQVQVNNLKEIINISTNSLSNSVNWAFGLIISLYAGVLIAIISWVLTQNIKWTKRKDD